MATIQGLITYEDDTFEVKTFTVTANSTSHQTEIDVSSVVDVLPEAGPDTYYWNNMYSLSTYAKIDSYDNVRFYSSTDNSFSKAKFANYAFNNCSTYTKGTGSNFNITDVSGIQDPVVTPLVENADFMYSFCVSLNGEPVMPDNLLTASNMYNRCAAGYYYSDRSKPYTTTSGLSGEPILSTKLKRIDYCYRECSNLTGECPTIPSTVTSANSYLSGQGSLSGVSFTTSGFPSTNFSNRVFIDVGGAPSCPDTVVSCRGIYSHTNVGPTAAISAICDNMWYTYQGCNNLTTPAVPPSSAKCNKYYLTYAGCFNLTSFVMTPQVGATTDKVNCQGMYACCNACEQDPVVSPYVNYAYAMYNMCTNVTKGAVCPDSVVHSGEMFKLCVNMKCDPVCGSGVVIAKEMYNRCYNLTNSPIVGSSVTNAMMMYTYCNNLNKQPVMTDVILDAHGMYSSCSDLIGDAVCGSSVTTMYSCYAECNNITNGVIGPAVTNANNAYSNSYKVNNITVLSKVITDCNSMCRRNMAYQLKHDDWHIWMPDWETYDPENPTTSATNDLIYSKNACYLIFYSIASPSDWIDCPEKNCYYFNYGTADTDKGNVVVHYGPLPKKIKTAVFTPAEGFNTEFAKAPKITVI